MAKLLFSLRGVPDDEADEVRDLLIANDIDYYETSAGNWNISMPALWLKNDADFTKTRQLLDAYQQNRATSARARYLELKQQGQHLSMFQTIKKQPLRFIGYIAVMSLIIYASVKMVLDFGA
ncbi:MAG: DUF6164 family protein [Methylococcales bacterium]